MGVETLIAAGYGALAGGAVSAARGAGTKGILKGAAYGAVTGSAGQVVGTAFSSTSTAAPGTAAGTPAPVTPTPPPGLETVAGEAAKKTLLSQVGEGLALGSALEGVRQGAKKPKKQDLAAKRGRVAANARAARQRDAAVKRAGSTPSYGIGGTPTLIGG